MSCGVKGPEQPSERAPVQLRRRGDGSASGGGRQTLPRRPEHPSRGPGDERESPGRQRRQHVPAQDANLVEQPADVSSTHDAPVLVPLLNRASVPRRDRARDENAGDGPPGEDDDHEIADQETAELPHAQILTTAIARSCRNRKLCRSADLESSSPRCDRSRKNLIARPSWSVYDFKHI